MGGPPDENVCRIDDVVAWVRDLERRVSALEQRPETLPSLPAAVREPDLMTALPSVPSGMIAVAGKALLGIAGAYLLRAVAESGSVPQLAVVVAALLYAGGWLFASSRVRGANRVTTVVYGITAALVMAPLLWETTVRFQVLPVEATAAVLVLFVVASVVLAWWRDLEAIAWIGVLVGCGTAVALISATRQVAPFAAALLGIALVVEVTACCDRFFGERWVAAIAVDIAAFLVGPVGIAALLAIYLGSTLFRTVVRGLEITIFEIAQAVIAASLLIATRSTSAGVFAIVAAVACYAIAFVARRPRNQHAYATFGIALVLTGCYLLLSGKALIATWSGIAVAALLVGQPFHAAAFLVAAAVASGLSPASWIAIPAALCYGLAPTKSRIPRAIVAAVCLWTVLGLAARVESPTLNTALVCALAIGLAYAGPRTGRPELNWLVYPLLLLGAAKVVAEDFNQGHAVIMAASLVFYGATLILLPKLRPHAPKTVDRTPSDSVPTELPELQGGDLPSGSRQKAHHSGD